MPLSNWINPKYLKPKKIITLKKEFDKNKPYPHLQLPGFLKEAKARTLLKELLQVSFSEKDSDLFHFFQTSDIASIDKSALQSFRSFLKSDEFLRYMHSLTGLSFRKNTVDLAGTLYSNTHYLLCHDDQLEGRNIAFLLYLSSLEKKDGGTLDLLDTKQKVVKKLLPKFNCFTFFHVSPISFHAVEEVVTDAKRVALGGWLHDE